MPDQIVQAVLQITIPKAGDPEKLGALVNAACALAAAEQPTKLVVPIGYRCVECYASDGSHENSCSIGIITARNVHEKVEAVGEDS